MHGLYFKIALDLFAACGAVFALWKGGAAERATAFVIIINILIAEAAYPLGPATLEKINFVSDGLTAAVILAITIRYGALWMGGVMLFYAAQFSLHSFYIVTERHTDNLHALINNIDFQAIVWCLIMGTAVAWRRRVRAKVVAGAGSTAT